MGFPDLSPGYMKLYIIKNNEMTDYPVISLLLIDYLKLICVIVRLY